ncbi:putative lipid scramblase CLPTM1 [Halyomorpha halys]|uniref:putative lipid scramblase CLPTM1 n=1 Tax=Halyomorpha halys TaxID=286706 RepID=UPI0006D4DEFE|nr:cleft lip and palate transmembrane protein 1 homolog [Halyomorpha halys]
MIEETSNNVSGGNASSETAQNGQLSPQGSGDNQNAGQEPPRRSMFEITKGFLLRAFFMYMIASFFRKSPSTPDSTTTPARPPALNYFENSTLMDLYVFLSEHEIFTNFNDSNALIWEKHDLVYGDWLSGPDGDGTYTFETTIKASEKIRNNGSLYLHTYVIKKEDTSALKNVKERLTDVGVAYSSKQLNKFKKLRYTKTQNLLTGESPLTPEEMEQAEKTNQAIISHWHPNITINFVTDQTNWIQGTIPSPLNEFIEFTPNGNYYKPVVFYNDFWNLLRDYQPINETTQYLELKITYQPLSLFKWQMYLAHSMRSRFTANIFQDETEDEDQDSLKEALLETSPYLLTATVIISILHSVFELLAFKNDIQFWNNRKSLEGLSVRSVFFNVFQSLIVLLYVLDNDTNTLIKISCFVGLAIEVWKINKVVDISLNRENKLFGILPRLKFTDKGSYVESSTRQYDQLAFKYLSWVLFPMLAGYSVYSLIYLHHKGWYSWVLNMIYGFLLMFGFIMMTPQLFINYKLKSVAHMPWRMMSYKCLNTFIDDIFAFVIKMPTMYRLGCFRDDIVFFIFLYQRWIYKTDPKRINEFGFSGEMENQVADKPEESPIKSIEAKKED